MINARALTLRFKGTDSEIVYQRLLQVYQWDHEDPRYARDAVGRVVVEDGLVRMQPHGSGLRRPTLRAALEKIQSRKSGFWSTLSNRHVWFDKEVATVEEV